MFDENVFNATEEVREDSDESVNRNATIQGTGKK